MYPLLFIPVARLIEDMMTNPTAWADYPTKMLRHTHGRARVEPPPEGPNTETDDEFQRRVDALLAYRKPWWQDVVALCAILGTLCLAFAAALWAMA